MSKDKKPEFITPRNVLKNKLGDGGLNSRVIELAQRMIDQAGVDFLPLGQRFLVGLQEGMRVAATSRGQMDDEALINTMLFPAVQLKANGGMFGYPLVTAVAGRLVRFLEYVTEVNNDMLEVVSGFVTALQALMLLSGSQKREPEPQGVELYKALDEACARYFARYGGSDSN